MKDNQPIICLAFSVSANYRLILCTFEPVTWLNFHHITLVLPIPFPLYHHKSEESDYQKGMDF